MGVLDDAIREHLELKRQHGASADEVTKQEQEALGAVQGQPVTSAPAADPPPAVEPEDPAPKVDAAPAEEPAVPDLEVDAELTNASAPPDEPAAVADGPETVVQPAASEPEQWLDSEPEFEPPAAPEPSGNTPPRGFEEVPEAPAPARETLLSDDASGEEDVLEETPEFLQETPEHDRLWFEQKPPREFDFDDE